MRGYRNQIKSRLNRVTKWPVKSEFYEVGQIKGSVFH